MNKDRDKFLTEAMGGKLVYCCAVDTHEDDVDETCVLQPDNGYLISDCMYAKEWMKPNECDYWVERLKEGVGDFSTWESFGKLFEWSSEQEWWDRSFTYDLIDDDCQRGMIPYKFINPNRFANALYLYLKEEELYEQEG